MSQAASVNSHKKSDRPSRSRLFKEDDSPVDKKSSTSKRPPGLQTSSAVKNPKMNANKVPMTRPSRNIQAKDMPYAEKIESPGLKES